MKKCKCSLCRGQLYVVDDSVSNEELMNHIAQRFNSSAKNKRTKKSTHENRSSKKTNANAEKKRAVNGNKCNTRRMSTPRPCSKANKVESSSLPHTYTSSSTHGFHCRTGVLRKIRGGNDEMSGIRNTSRLGCTPKTTRKRRNTSAEEEDNNSKKRKMQKPCEILKEKLKQTMPVPKNACSSKKRKLECGNISEIPTSFEEKCSGKPATSAETFSMCETERYAIEDLNHQQDLSNDTHVGTSNDVAISNNSANSLNEDYDCCQSKTKIMKTTSSTYDSEKTAAESRYDNCRVFGRESHTFNGNCHGVSESSDVESTLHDTNSLFNLTRVFDSENISAAAIDDDDDDDDDIANHEVGQNLWCNDTRVPTVKDIPDWMYVALDCEMVGVGPKGGRSVLARCSIVDYDGNVLYDKFVLPPQRVTDYRTRWSGVSPVHMKTAVPTQIALKDIKECLSNKIVIGHSVYHDFRVLGITPDPHFVRDTAQCKLLVEMANLQGKGNSLKKLSAALLDRDIQKGKKGHCSVEDARATLDLFKLVRRTWEPELYSKWAKKEKNIFAKIARFVETGTRHRDQEDHIDFLNDRFWPSDI